MSAPLTFTPPKGYTGDCEAGQRDCTCGQAVGMWHVERDHPWRWAAGYAAMIFGVMLLSHAFAAGWLQ